jgi:hypothetical protein
MGADSLDSSTKADSSTKQEVSRQEQAILSAIKQLREEINGIIGTLVRLDEQHFPESLIHFHIQPAVLGGEKRMGINVRGEFLKDIDELENLVRLLQGELAGLRARHPFLVYKIMREDALRTQAKFRTKTQRELAKDAKDRGEVDGKDLDRLAHEAERVLQKCVTVLNANPTRENMKLVVDAMGDPLFLGGSSYSGASSKARQALQRASLARLKYAHSVYQGAPTDGNRRKLMKAAEEALFFGIGPDVVNSLIQGAVKK